MLCEINPLIVTPDGEVKALDSKFTVDDNALFRHADIAEMRDPEAYPPEERAAREKGVTYVKLDGSVGILANGAGLGMSTLDVVALAGGRAANFCDLGGGGDAQTVVDALEIITGDPQVKSILFNIFGGITRCDEVARGILEALDQMTIEHPIVVRLDGTNAEEGRKLLADAAPPNLEVEPTMLDAARRAVELGEMTDVWSERARGVPPERGAPRGPGSRPDRRVGRGLRRRRSTSRPAAGTSRAAARGRAERRHHRRGAGHAARRDRARGGPARSPTARPTWSSPARRPPLRRRPRRGARDGAGRREDGRDRRQHVRRRGARGGRARPRPVARPLLHGRGVARALRATPGLRVDEIRSLPQRVEVEPWLARAGCEGEEADRVRELAADRIEDGWITLDRMAIKGVKS